MKRETVQSIFLALSSSPQPFEELEETKLRRDSEPSRINFLVLEE